MSERMAATSLRVRVTPRAARTEVARYEAGVLHARVAASPVDDAANRALIELLADVLGCRKSALAITSGASSRDKRVTVDGMDEAALAAQLARFEG